MAADERFHVGGAVNAGETALEHELGDTRGGFDLGFEDVGLQPKNYAQAPAMPLST